MTYNDIIKKQESIGIEIDYTKIDVPNLDAECPDEKAFEEAILNNKK